MNTTPPALRAQKSGPQLVITRLCRPAGRIKIIVAGEPLGY